MTEGSATPPELVPALAPDGWLGLLLFSASHDLKSPLLTVSLSGELLAGADGDAERARLAFETLQHGVHDLERMLEALMALSRATRRTLEARPVPLQQLLRGQLVLSDDPEATRLLVAADPRPVLEGLAALTNGGATEVRLHRDDTAAQLDVRAAVPLPALPGPSPLAALLGSLEAHAGGVVQALAAVELQLARQAATLRIAGDRVHIGLPLAAGVPAV